MKVSPPINAFDEAAPAGLSVPARPPSALARRLRKWRGLLLVVALPTALATAYFTTLAADQYVSEARFFVRGPSSNTMMSGLGAVLGGAGFKSVPEDSLAVREYLRSPDLVRELRHSIDLVGVWRRPEADFAARLWFSAPTVESLTRYFRRMVVADYDTESSTVSLQVRTFRAEDSKMLAEALLRASENLVNRIGERQRGGAVADARREVEIAERRVVAAREALTAFRQEGRAIDPTREAVASMETVAKLEGALSQARADLQERLAFMRPDNPQVAVLRNRIASLETQIGAERQRLTAGDGAAPRQLAGYERLMLEREFADRQLASAVTSLETARADAARQQIYLARVTEPQEAESALYPKATYTVVSLLAVLLVIYGIGSLVLSGFREHAS
ncbi:capsule biosynthesis protein [Roseomonas nepalensis]|uniref:Capsule biosynthesis protein n=1 Tax=Muricoccus nepalensis TaxID=1854500 RepID=A0A502G938_9PROT|nr:capsule biosynthesis protein [Roseomonas nepalensis]TPG58141.1 capsule biosynthesis protein [Roseomonas nepalensis]